MSSDLTPHESGTETESWRPKPGEIAALARQILEEALRLQASDVHLHSQAEGILVRFRVDGLLHDMQMLSHPKGRRLIHHFKAIAGMNIVERRRPQDGRVLLEADGREIDLRLATIHALWGENLAVRIFDRRSPCRSIEELGMPKNAQQQLSDLIYSPQGLLLVTGPTGSGKTATLYAALNQINRPEINIITVEDPVEQEIPRVNQIGVQPKIGLGFLECLRSAFRQDPDVLMIGEIRDNESARIAIRAALSGHLVMSTLHTGAATEAIAALIHLGIEPFLVASSLIGVVAQQLVRLICPGCRQQIPLEVSAADLDGPYRDALLRVAPVDQALSFSYGDGCPECMGSGYKDRTGLFEILRVTPAIRKGILQKASAEAIEDVAQAEGMTDMKTLGIRLVIAGRTTIEEVLRVVPVAEEEFVPVP